MNLSNNIANLWSAVGDVVNEVGESKLTRPDATEASIATLIGVRSYDKEKRLYQATQMSGFMLELTPLPGLSETGERHLLNLIDGLDLKGWAIQFVAFVNPHISDTLGHYLTTRKASDNPQLQVLARARSDNFARCTHTPLAPGQVWRVRSTRVLMSVTSAAPKSDDALMLARQHVLQLLETIGCPSKDVTPDMLITLLGSLTAPLPNKTAPIPRQWNEHDYINEQVNLPGSDIMVSRQGLEFSGGTGGRMFSVVDVPSFYRPGMMSGILGDIWNGRSFCPYSYVISLHIQAAKMAKTFVMAKAGRVSKDAGSFMQRYVPSLAKQAQDLRLAGERIDEGDDLTRITMQALVYAPQDKINEADASIKALFSNQGFKLLSDDGIQLPAFMAALPFGHEPTSINALQNFARGRTVLTSNALSFAPLYGEWRGNAGRKPPLLMLAGRRGELAGWSPFQSDGNYNVCVVGSSGQGKSVIMQDLMVGLAASGGSAIVLDDGHSFENICKLLGGTHIDFAEAKIELNPFAVLDKKAMARDREFRESAFAMLAAMLGAMCRPGKDPDDIERALLVDGVQSVWDKHGNDGKIDNVLDYLGTRDEAAAAELMTMLRPFTSEGAYGEVFNHGCSLDFSNPINVYELSSLRDKQEFSAAVMMLIIFLATQKMYRSGRDHPVAIIIDEAWSLLAGAGSSFIEGVARRARKFNGSLITGTQSVEDYFKNPAAEAAWANSDWTLFLGQKDSSIQALKREQRIHVGEDMERALRSVSSVKGLWSELILFGAGGYDMFRVVLDPLSLAAFSSTGEDVMRVQELIKSGYTHEDALKTLAQDIEAQRGIKQGEAS